MAGDRHITSREAQPSRSLSLPLAMLVALGTFAASTNARAQEPQEPAAPPGGPAAPEATLSPHPAAAVDPHPEDTVAPGAEVPWSFSDPLAWPLPKSRIDVAGYLLPQFEYVSFPTALPRDRTQYGARGSRVGFALHGTPIENWSYIAHVVIIPAGTESLGLLSPTTASSPAVSLAIPTATGTSIDVEEASLAYRPKRWFVSKLGVIRMPFSVAQATPIPKQMLPFRAPQTAEFQSGADQGLLATVAPFDARLQVNVGLFVGSSLGGGAANQTVRGPALSAQVAAHPLGAMSLREGDMQRGSFKFAVGFGSIYRSATLLDATGYETSSFRDTRFAAFVRAQLRGVYVQAEYLRRLRTDDLSGRPSVSEGGYAAASYYQPVGSVAVGPVLRAGAVTTDIGFASRTYTSFEGGLAFYPRGGRTAPAPAPGGAPPPEPKPGTEEPEKLRILVEYLGASVSPLTEVQREALVQLQLEF